MQGLAPAAKTKGDFALSICRGPCGCQVLPRALILAQAQQVFSDTKSNTGGGGAIHMSFQVLIL